MTKLDYYDCIDFIDIEKGEIHWLGYFYVIYKQDDMPYWRVLQYKHYDTTIQDFIEEYDNDPSEAYEQKGVKYTQYIDAMEDDPETYTQEWFEDELNRWLENAIHIDPEDIVLDMPDGHYVLVKEPYEEEYE